MLSSTGANAHMMQRNRHSRISSNFLKAPKTLIFGLQLFVRFSRPGGSVLQSIEEFPSMVFELKSVSTVLERERDL